MRLLPAIVGLGAAGIAFFAFKKIAGASTSDIRPPSIPGQCPDNWTWDQCLAYWDAVNNGMGREDALRMACEQNPYGAGCPSWVDEENGEPVLVTPTEDGISILYVCAPGDIECERKHPGAFIRELPSNHWLNMSAEERAAQTAADEARAQEEAVRFAAEHEAVMGEQPAIQAEHENWWASGQWEPMVDAFNYGVLVYPDKINRADIYSSSADKPDPDYFPGGLDEARSRAARVEGYAPEWVGNTAVSTEALNVGRAKWNNLTWPQKTEALLDYMALVLVKTDAWMKHRFLAAGEESGHSTGERGGTSDIRELEQPGMRFVAVWQPQSGARKIPIWIKGASLATGATEMSYMAGTIRPRNRIAPGVYIKR